MLGTAVKMPGAVVQASLSPNLAEKRMGGEPLSFRLCKDICFGNDLELELFLQRKHCPGGREGGCICGQRAALVCCTKANFFPGNWCSEKCVRSPEDKGRREMILRAAWLGEQWSSATFL